MTASVFRLPISVVRVPVKCQHPVRVALFAAADEGHGDIQRLRSDHVITYSAINRKLYYSLTEIRRVLKPP